jgi:hypothetical protein
MGWCYVEMRGNDGQLHATTLDADSLFEAAEKAATGWSRLWWYDPTTLITVRYGEQS